LPSGGWLGLGLTAVGEGFLARRFVAGDSVCLLGVVSFSALERGAGRFLRFFGGECLSCRSLDGPPGVICSRRWCASGGLRPVFWRAHLWEVICLLGDFHCETMGGCWRGQGVLWGYGVNVHS